MNYKSCLKSVTAILLPFLAACDGGTNIPQNYLAASDVQMVLGCRLLPGQSETESIQYANGDYSTYICKNSEDGTLFELDAQTRENGKEFRSAVKASLVHPNVYDIQVLVLDNVEKPRSDARKIYDTLNWIGVNRVRRVLLDTRKTNSPDPAP